jgi:hypothetical protein
MHGGLNAVVLLDVQLGEGVVLKRAGFLDITKSRGVNHVSYVETLDSLVLRDRLGGRNAPNREREQTKSTRRCLLERNLYTGNERRTQCHAKSTPPKRTNDSGVKDE